MRDRKSDRHRKAAELKLGRPIKPGHDIDHRNENKEDNNPANLQELPHGEHSSLTGSKERRTLRQLQKSLAMPAKKEKLY
jgi:hypothetical protein